MFHTSIRLDEGVLVRNAFIDRKWGVEDRYGKFDFKYNKSFEIIFLAELEFYKIAVNGVHIGVFRHRLPLNLVNFIHVKGDIQIEHILLEQDAQSAQAIGAITSNTSAYVPFTPAVNPQIQISYQPPGQHQISSIQTTQPSHNHHMSSPPYPINPSAPHHNSNQPPPYNPQWVG
jgi:hypothetical protein